MDRKNLSSVLVHQDGFAERLLVSHVNLPLTSKFSTWPRLFVPARVKENSLWREAGTLMKIYMAEQIVTLLRQIELEIADEKSTPQACRDTAVTVQTYDRWRKEFGGLKLDQAKRLKELERENAKLKRLVAELSLEKQILKDVAEGNF